MHSITEEILCFFCLFYLGVLPSYREIECTVLSLFYDKIQILFPVRHQQEAVSVIIGVPRISEWRGHWGLGNGSWSLFAVSNVLEFGFRWTLSKLQLRIQDGHKK